MNTLRVMAAIGLGLSLAFASGCNSDSKPATKDGSAGGNRGTGGSGAGGGAGGRDAAGTRATCTNNGTTYNAGQTFVQNCVTYLCVSGTNFTSSGSPCSDAGPITPTDTRVNQDLPQGTEVGRRDAGAPDIVAPVDQGGGRDTSPTEVGRRDTVAPLDTGAPDLFVPEDTASPEPDLPIVVVDAEVIINLDAPPPVVQCSYHGQKYPVGDFACDCNTCTCEIGGTITPVTTNDCTIDAF